MKNPEVKINSGDEIIIVIPEDMDEDEVVIDLDELGIDIENLSDEVNIIVQMEGADDIEDGGEFLDQPNEWCWEDDPYGIVYYEFPDDYGDEE